MKICLKLIKEYDFVICLLLSYSYVEFQASRRKCPDSNLNDCNMHLTFVNVYIRSLTMTFSRIAERTSG